jgi:hypothetical protein
MGRTSSINKKKACHGEGENMYQVDITCTCIYCGKQYKKRFIKQTSLYNIQSEIIHTIIHNSDFDCMSSVCLTCQKRIARDYGKEEKK